jgi:hypothetical protein
MSCVRACLGVVVVADFSFGRQATVRARAREEE